MIGVEGGHSIGGSLGTLRILAELGAGYLTLTHNDDTAWADSATGERAHGGLTTFGEEVVRELNRLGVLVDLSHVSEDTMRQAIEVSEAPVIFSHSNARALCDVPRNVPDDVIELVGRTGGRDDGDVRAVVPHRRGRRGRTTPSGRRSGDCGREHADDPDAVRAAVEAGGRRPTDAAELRRATWPTTSTTSETSPGSITSASGAISTGSPAMPDGLEDVSRIRRCSPSCADRGYTDEDLAKIAGRNVLRVMREAERESPPDRHGPSI